MQDTKRDFTVAGMSSLSREFNIILISFSWYCQVKPEFFWFSWLSVYHFNTWEKAYSKGGQSPPPESECLDHVFRYRVCLVFLPGVGQGTALGVSHLGCVLWYRWCSARWKRPKKRWASFVAPRMWTEDKQHPPKDLAEAVAWAL